MFKAKTRSELRKEYNQQRVAGLQKFKESTPCADCGGYFPYYVMEFDHVRGNKEFAIANHRYHGRLKVMAEIEKCDIVCANCHRIRTHKRGYPNGQ